MKTVEYKRDKAVEYAHKWAYDRNPRYYDFSDLGGDCTSFISQAVFAGCGGVMNYSPPLGWYYKSIKSRSPSWTGVQFFYDFLVGNKGKGPFATEVEADVVVPGDVVQLSFDGLKFAHTTIIVEVESPSPDGIYVAAHTFNADNRPLNSYSYERARFLHIEGVRV